LGDDDLELAKRFNTRELSAGDVITPDMWKPNFKYKWGWVMNHPDLIKQITSESQIIEFVVHGDELYFSLEGVKDLIFTNDNLKSQYKVVNTNLDESFSLSDDDLELAKSFNVKYLKQNDTIKPEMWDSNKIKNIHYTDVDFNEPYKITGYESEVSWDEDGEYYTDVFLTDSWDDEIYEVLDNINLWLKPEFQVEVESLDESFELGDEDIELAKDFSPNPDIQVDVHVIYDFGGFQEELKHETTFRFLFKIPDLIEFIDENGYENITEGDIINNLDSEWLDDLILDTMNYHSSNHSELDKDTIWNNDTWLEENCDKILNPVDWSKIPYGTEIKKRELELSIDLLDPSKKVNEEFTLGDEDMELAKDFNKRELKVGDYFYESSNPEYAGAWTKLEDAPSLIRNFVQKIIYIGPNEGQYKEPSYYDDDIVAFEFAIDPQNVYTLTVNYFNRDFSDKINAYIPSKNTLDETFEMGPEDIGLANGLKVIKYLEVGNQITPNMWNPNNPDLENFIDNRDENWIISMIEDNYVYLNTENGNEISIDIENINYLLKPEYMIEPNIYNR
jgi:hypothetical protein